MSKITTEQFIDRAIQLHGNLYDYSNTIVGGMNNKVQIVCPTHGAFDQRAASHLSGSGCRLCKERQRLTKDQFVSRSTEKHDTRYTYHNVEYTNVTTKVNITCPSHGDFLQTPKDHMRGYGCPACGGTKRVSTDEFIDKAINVHGVRYDYSKLKVKGMNSKGTIICPIHGEFEQRLADHAAGVGCPTCSRENMGVYTQEFFNDRPDVKKHTANFYMVTGSVDDTRFCKVGITKQDITRRFSTENVNIKLCHTTTLYEAWKLERHILSQFRDARFKYKALQRRKFVGWSECFSMKLVDPIYTEIQKQIGLQHDY